MWLDSRHSRGASSIIEPKQERGAAFLFALPRWLPDRWVLCLETRLCGERITALVGREADEDERKLESDVKLIGRVNHSGQTIAGGAVGGEVCRNTRLASV